ncbi:hypothetical protein FA95DRAFT_219513 [Auriscalpium vulgare]|uniref:Uncharacterized protein n=1 Tax=Auriscalpium vulgare TaxID=40419 RepID=A0ACB8RLH7_9AGAM|nr:hypothetical protein FA95DRAFT_219513 [Auriscalpium vulgare]
MKAMSSPRGTGQYLTPCQTTTLLAPRWYRAVLAVPNAARSRLRNHETALPQINLSHSVHPGLRRVSYRPDVTNRSRISPQSTLSQPLARVSPGRSLLVFCVGSGRSAALRIW